MDHRQNTYTHKLKKLRDDHDAEARMRHYSLKMMFSINSTKNMCMVHNLIVN